LGTSQVAPSGSAADVALLPPILAAPMMCSAAMAISPGAVPREPVCWMKSSIEPLPRCQVRPRW
jgi:hypothetical protein